MKKCLVISLLVVIVATLSWPGTLPVQAAQKLPLKFWSTETQPERAKVTQDIIKRFTEKTGIQVQLVLTDENTLASLMTANLAAGTLPDVIFHPIDYTAGWYADKILDGTAATKVINDLGKETFSALGLVTDGKGGYMAVPCDGWGQLLIYRKDLFDKAGLDAPTTFDKILTAAQKLNDPSKNFFGITAATDPGAVFTQQTFEHFALANGVQLTDDKGKVTLDTPQMVEALKFFAELMKYAPPGKQDVSSTRATYFAGQAAMIVWSPFILDEMAGLRDNAMPSCPECKSDPAFLAKVSGFVPAFTGPSGKAPAQYGQVSLMGITTSAPPEAVDFVEYWLTDGYLDWLSVSPEGKFPMHRGTPEKPTLYIDGWRTLKTGVDKKAPLGDFYSQDVINEIVQGASNFARWGFNQGQGQLVSGVYQELPVPKTLADILSGQLSPEEGAKEIQKAVEDIQAAQQK